MEHHDGEGDNDVGARECVWATWPHLAGRPGRFKWCQGSPRLKVGSFRRVTSPHGAVREATSGFNAPSTAPATLSQGVGEALWPLAGPLPDLASAVSHVLYLLTWENQEVGCSVTWATSNMLLIVGPLAIFRAVILNPFPKGTPGIGIHH